MITVKSTLFILGLLCLLTTAGSAQYRSQTLIVPSIHASSEPIQPDVLDDVQDPFGGPAGGPSVAWHNYRQHRSAEDIAAGIVLTWDVPLGTISDATALSFRPGVSYLHPTFLIDAVLRLQYKDLPAVIAGFSFDPTADREFRFEDDTPEWMWINEHDRLGKRSFAVLGLQIPTGFAYYEFLYRIQLDKGSHAFYVYPDERDPYPSGYRRYFILSVGMGIWL